MGELAIIICATSRYQYALKAQARAIQQNLMTANIKSGHIVLVTDLKPVAGILERYRAILGEGFKLHHIPLALDDSHVNYKENAQLLIAQMYSAGFDRARALGADHVFTLESDVIPEGNVLRCLYDAVAFDGGYYSVAFGIYVSQGGGGIMGGRGHERHHILPNVYEDEHDAPKELQETLKEHREKLEPGKQPSPEWIDEAKRLEDEVKKFPPKGNVFTLNGQRWRQRGWLEAAYPGIGRGAVLESNWMPMGCNLFSSRAIPYVDFLGYRGAGTQDLYLTFRRLKQHGIRIGVVPHALAHHVIRKDGGYKLIMLRHEPDGECEGHLRHEEIPWFSHEPGETVPVITADFAI